MNEDRWARIEARLDEIVSRLKRIEAATGASAATGPEDAPVAPTEPEAGAGQEEEVSAPEAGPKTGGSAEASSGGGGVFDLSEEALEKLLSGE